MDCRYGYSGVLLFLLSTCYRLLNEIIKVIDDIGLQRIIAFSSDNTGNTRVAREILSTRNPHTLNLPDPEHHLNNTWKDIASLDYFKAVRFLIVYVRLKISHFSFRSSNAYEGQSNTSSIRIWQNPNSNNNELSRSSVQDLKALGKRGLRHSSGLRYPCSDVCQPSVNSAQTEKLIYL
jgi:hypothetical protein